MSAKNVFTSKFVIDLILIKFIFLVKLFLFIIVFLKRVFKYTKNLIDAITRQKIINHLIFNDVSIKYRVINFIKNPVRGGIPLMLNIDRVILVLLFLVFLLLDVFFMLKL